MRARSWLGNLPSPLLQVRVIDRTPVRPLSYDRHVYFFDFADFGSPNPVWFSLVRDPIRKFESK